MKQINNLSLLSFLRCPVVNKRRQAVILTIVSLCLLLLVPGTAPSKENTASRYNISGLPVPAGSPAINNLGHVVDQHYLWAEGNLSGLDSLESEPMFIKAKSININGQVIGYARLSNREGCLDHAFLWENGVMTDLGMLEGCTWSRATHINDLGQVIGYCSPTESSSDGQAFLWENGTMTPLSIDYAADINNWGQVVGGTDLWDRGVITDLGNVNAFAINDYGQLCGHDRLSNHAILWENGLVTDLGTLGGESSRAFDINTSGQVVGYAYIDPQNALYQSGVYQSEMHAFLYTEGTMYDLNELIPPNSGWELEQAWSINDSGEIAGYGTYCDPESGKREVLDFLLTPAGPAISDAGTGSGRARSAELSNR